MLVGLIYLLELALYVEMFSKSWIAAGHFVLIVGSGIFFWAGFTEPMPLLGQIGCRLGAPILLALEVLFAIKCVRWGREAKAAQISGARAT